MAASMLVLLAGLTVGIGPEPTSQETEQHFLRGSWEGTWHSSGGVLDVVVNEREISFPQFRATAPVRWVDEGRGNCRLLLLEDGDRRQGIYKHEAGRLVICLSEIRPLIFKSGQQRVLVVLQKPSLKK